MSSYGVGQGLAQGVQMLVPMMRMHQQNEQFKQTQALRQQYADAYSKASQLKMFGGADRWDDAYLSRFRQVAPPSGPMQAQRLGVSVPPMGAQDLMQPKPQMPEISPAAMLIDPAF